jgi:predicted kinase
LIVLPTLLPAPKKGNKMKTLYLIRGIPGSGKSTLARQLAHYVFEADDYFKKDGEYVFVPADVGKAHEACQRRVEAMMDIDGTGENSTIAVSNTFTRLWEMQPYKDLAKKYGYTVFTILCQNDFGNVHGVPAGVVQRMKERME